MSPVAMFFMGPSSWEEGPQIHNPMRAKPSSSTTAPGGAAHRPQRHEPANGRRSHTFTVHHKGSFHGGAADYRPSTARPTTHCVIIRTDDSFFFFLTTPAGAFVWAGQEVQLPKPAYRMCSWPNFLFLLKGDNPCFH